VLAGKGPCNAQRIQHRRQAHEDGAWAREAAAEYARKHAAATGPDPSPVPEPVEGQAA
jgi:ring-1,2-phenylacetyl-CoA epoxidase subunit PaaA